MPISHRGFDYLVTSHDTFAALRNFIIFLTWVFGDTWAGSFESDIRKWLTESPWVETPVWILHLGIEKAISSWILFCHSDASIFRYRGLVTSWGSFEDYLGSFMLPENLKLLDSAYNRSLALQVVYPNKDCLVPLEVPSFRPPPRFASVESQSGGASLQPLVLDHASDKKRKLEVVVDSTTPKKPVGRYCHANVAYIFGLAMKAKSPGACKEPGSMTGCSYGEHFGKGNRPAVEDVMKSIEDIRGKRSDFGDELLAKLQEHQD
jgi:hypothetical protein